MATKSTKKDAKESIKKTYASEKSKSAAKKALTVDPYEETKKAEKKRVKASAEEFIKSEFVSEVIKQQFHDLEQEINEKKALIENLYGIEAEGAAMADLVNAHNVLQAELDEEAAKNQAERQALKEKEELEKKNAIEELKAEFDKTKKALDLEEKTYKNDLKVAREREAAEYSYNLNRTRSKENDEWEDVKAAREKELAGKEADLAKRVEEVVAREAKISELEAKVNEIPELIKKATEDGKAQGIKETNTSHVFEKRAIEKQAEYDKSLLTKEIQLQQSVIEDLQAKVRSLEEKLDAAYVRNQDLATTVAKNSGVKEVYRPADTAPSK
jgi:hypothetical protein